MLLSEKSVPYVSKNGTSLRAVDNWNANGKIARVTTYATTDHQPATVEVDCRHELRVRLVHPYLSRLPVHTDDPRPGWYGRVLLTNGWGLDLTRPGQQGVRSA